jgi:hypothetical protein
MASVSCSAITRNDSATNAARICSRSRPATPRWYIATINATDAAAAIHQGSRAGLAGIAADLIGVTPVASALARAMSRRFNAALLSRSIGRDGTLVASATVVADIALSSSRQDAHVCRCASIAARSSGVTLSSANAPSSAQAWSCVMGCVMCALP